MVEMYTLKGIDLDEVSLVDRPANPGASVVLYKRNATSENGGNNAGIGSGNGGIGENTMPIDNAEFEKLKSEHEELKKQAADITKRAIAAEQELAKRDEELKKNAEETIEFNGEKIAKSSVPAPILKALETQSAQLKKMEADAKEVKLAKRGAEELPNLSGTALQKGMLLDLVDNLNESDKKAIHECLKAADNAVKKTFAEFGTTFVDESSAEAKLDKCASEYAKEHKVPFATAYAEVSKTAEGSALRKQIDADNHK